MRKVVGTLFILLFCFGLSSSALAQSSDSNLWGIWKLADPNMQDFSILMIFTPNGSWGIQYIEGITYGQYTADGATISINGTTEYAETAHWQQSFRYEVSGSSLRLYDMNGSFNGSVQDYFKMTTFSGFGFLHCAASVKSNMFVGAYGHVTYTDGTASRVRSAPSTSAQIVERLPEGSLFLVTGEPSCADGYTWWPIHTHPNSPGSEVKDLTPTGWIAEGENGVAFIEPIGWVEDSMVRHDQPVSIATNLTNFADMAGATVYAPGTYPYTQQVANALASGEASGVAASLYDFINKSYEVVKDANLAGNPVHIICMATAFAGTHLVPAVSEDEATGFICFAFDVAKDVIELNPVSLTIDVTLQVLSKPETYIDPWLDPINKWADSRPISRFICWVKPDFCPLGQRPN